MLYVGAVFITYAIIGLGFFSFLGWLGENHIAARVAAVIALVMAAWMLKDVFLPGWGPSMATPAATHGWMHRAMQRGGLAGPPARGVRPSSLGRLGRWNRAHAGTMRTVLTLAVVAMSFGLLLTM